MAISSRKPEPELDTIIAPEINKDEFYYTIQRLARDKNIKTVLEIGSSAGAGSTEAFVTGLRKNPNKPTLFCIEMSRPRFAELQKRYIRDSFVRCYNVSSVSSNRFLTKEDIIQFYDTTKTALNNYPINTVLEWLRQDIEYLKNSGLPDDGIRRIKRENSITNFDMVLVDGSAFTAAAELDEVYGANFILLDDINDIKNYKNFKRLSADPNYLLVSDNWKTRNGFAIFKWNDTGLPIHFFTIVLNGEPFIRHHIEVFRRLPFKWHWHIIEGVAELIYDTAWSLTSGGRITNDLHENGLSRDGTTEYLDEVAAQFPENITIYRKAGGTFWNGKLEMVNAPVANLQEECLLWQIDADELWTVEQIVTARELFIYNPHKTAAYYFCNYFVGENLVIGTRDTYGNHSDYEWLRTWRFKPGDRWMSHEPPRLIRKTLDEKCNDVAATNFFKHAETEAANLIFQHFAYITEDQVRFKQVYYGYESVVRNWKALQKQSSFPLLLKNYFPWVEDNAQVDCASSFNIRPIAQKDSRGKWYFKHHMFLTGEPVGVDSSFISIPEDNVLSASSLPHIKKRFHLRSRQKKNVIVISHERSGTHFLINTIAANFPYYSNNEISVVGNSVELNHIFSWYFTEREKRIFKSHHQFYFFTSFFEDLIKHFHIFYIVRDGRDVLTSCFEYFKKNPYVFPTARTFSDYIAKVRYLGYSIKYSENMIERWVNHINSWATVWDRIHIIRYEDLIIHFESTVSSIADIMSLNMTSQLRRPTLEDRCVSPRKGVVGDWENHFSKKDVQIFDSIAYDCMKAIGYYESEDKSMPHISASLKRESTLLTNDTKTILWIRTDSIGDNVLAASMLPHIRTKYKSARIVVVCQEHIAELYEACPFVDDIMSFERKRVYEDEQYRTSISQRLRGLNADIAMNCVYSREPLTDFFAIEGWAKQRIAFNGDLCNIEAEIRDKHNRLYTRLIPSDGESKTELERHKDFLMAIGIGVDSLGPMIWTTSDDEEFADEFFEKNRLNSEKTIALFAGAQYEVRMYSQYGRALSEICKSGGFSVIALGAADERKINEQNLSMVDIRTFNLCGQTTIRQAAAILKRCRLAVGSETGLAHISCAAGTRNVVLLGGGHFGRFMPYSYLTSVVCLPLDCYGCNWKCKYSRPHCVDDVLPEVIGEALRLTLDETSDRPQVFVQDCSLWAPEKGLPRWRLFNKFTDLAGVNIIRISDLNMLKKSKTLTRKGEDVVAKARAQDGSRALTEPVEAPQRLITAHNNLGVLCWHRGETTKALEHFMRAMETDANDRSTVMNCAEALKKLGRDEDAKVICKGYLERNPDDEEVKKALADSEKRYGESQRVSITNMPKDKYLVSAIVSTHNAERFIRGSLEDLEAQTIADRLEIIVVDSGSQQNEGGIVREFQQQYHNILYIRTGNRETVYAAWNCGIKAANGRYITNANTDDRHRKDALERMVNELETRPDVALVYGDAAVTDKENRSFACADVNGHFRWPEFDKRLLFQVCYVGPQPMWRRDLHERHGYFDPEFQSAGDYEFWLRIVTNENFAHIPDVLGLYFISKMGIEHQNETLSYQESEKARERYWPAAWGQRPVPGGNFFVSVCPSTAGPTPATQPPAVSVIIPTFNRPDQLHKALASLKAQTFRNFEVLVINDGGIDVGPILKVFGDKLTIEYIRHATNLDRSAARNSGLRAARGKYVAYLDDDDIFYPDHLETLVTFLEGSPYKVAYTDAYRAQQEKENGEYVVRKRDVPYSVDFDYDGILVGNFIPVLCVMHERSCLAQVGLFDETLTSHEDWDLWIRLSRRFEFAHIRKVTAEFAWRSDGSTTTSGMGKDFLRTAEIIYQKCREYTKDKPHILEAQRQSIQWRKSKLSGLPKGVLCSIIVPVFNRLEYTKQCLKTLAENTPNDLYEVIVVDNGSSDGTKDFLKCLEGNVKTLSNEENAGFAKACNQGAALADGKYLVFLNNDTEPKPGWLGEMVKTTEEDSCIGIVGSRLLYPDGTVQHAGIYFEEHGIPYHAFRGFPKDHPMVLEVRDCPAVTGACLLIARKLFERLGGFDEGYQMYVEDVDLCLRVWEAGFRVAYCGASVVIHYESASVTDIAQRDRQVREGWSRLLERWANRWPVGLQPHLQAASSAQFAMADRAVANDNTAKTPRLLWHAPIFDPSGYANEARHFIFQLDKQGFEVAARPVGRHSAGFRSQLEPEIRDELDRALEREIESDFISVVQFPAYGFERLPQASYNIGRTTFETDSLPAEWVEKCNQMDEVWVPSEFNIQTFRGAGVTTKLFKVPEGIDTERFRPGRSPLSIPGAGGFVFLSVFEWVYRKGWDLLLRAWAKAFDPCEKVTLVLRTYPINAADLPNSSQEIDRRIDLFLQNELGLARRDVAPIIVLGDQIPEADMPRLYAAASAYVAPSRGEGWGRPQMEAMACGLPVIATRWGGNLEFMNDENSYLINIEGLVEIDDCAEIAFYRGQRWAEPSVDHLVSLLRQAYEHPAEGLAMGGRAREDMVNCWAWERVAEIAAGRLKTIHAELLARGAVLSSIRTKKALSVKWEGSQFVHHSLALINREMCLRLIDAGCELSIISYEPDQFDATLDERFYKLARCVGVPLSHPAQVHVRHQWPPKFEPPAEGHWIMIQPWEFGSLPKRWVEVMSSQVDDVWVPSHYLRECYIRSGIPDDRVHVIPNGVNVDRFRPDASPVSLETKKRFKFLFVGGTIWRKGADLLLDAYLKMFSADDDVCLVIKDMGGNSFYKDQTSAVRIREIQAQPDSPEILYLTENMAPNDLPGLYTVCDCLVQPYRGEGFGLPIAEAMACGLPVIVTDYGAALDFCNEENAYLVPAVESRFSERRVGDIETVDYPWLAEPDLEMLSRLMRHVFDDPVGGREKGQRGRAFVEDHLTWEKVAQKVLERVMVLRTRPIRRHSVPDRHFRWVRSDPLKVRHDLEGRLRAGEEALHEGHDQDAEQIFKDILKDDPRNPQAHNDLACLLWQTGRVEEALQELTEAMKIALHDGDVIWNCGQVLTELGFLEDALEVYQDFVKNHPDEPEFTEAIHSLEGLLNDTDGTAHAGRKLVEQGEHLFRQGKVDEAIASFKEALEIDPDLAVAHNNLAIAYHDKGKLENAIQALMSAMRLAPDDPDVIWNCGQILIELGYLKDALEVYKDFLEKNPDDLGFTGGVRDLVDSLNRDNLVAVNSKAERTPIVSVASHP